MKFVLGALAVLSITLMVVTGTDPILPWLVGTSVEPWLYKLRWTNGIVFNLAAGFLVSLFFWCLLVSAPELKRRKVVKGHLTERYRLFKEKLVMHLMWAAGEGHRDDEVRHFVDDAKAFQDYLTPARQTAMMQGLSDQAAAIQNEMKALSKELTLGVQLCPVRNKTYQSLRHVVKALDMHESLASPDDDRKNLMRFLVYTLTHWDFAGGQAATDVIQDLIDQL